MVMASVELENLVVEVQVDTDREVVYVEKVLDDLVVVNQYRSQVVVCYLEEIQVDPEEASDQVVDCLVRRDDHHLGPEVVQAYQDQDPCEHHCEEGAVHQQEAIQEVVLWQQVVVVLLGLPAFYHWNSIKTHKSIA